MLEIEDKLIQITSFVIDIKEKIANITHRRLYNTGVSVGGATGAS